MAPDITGATPDIFEKGSEDLAFIKYIRFGKEKGRVEILPDESDKRAKTVRVTEFEKKNFSKRF